MNPGKMVPGKNGPQKNDPWKNGPRKIVPWKIGPRIIYPGDHFSRGPFFQGPFFRGPFFRGPYFPGTIFPGDHFSGTIFPGIIFPGTIFPGTIFPGFQFLVSCYSWLHTYMVGQGDFEIRNLKSKSKIEIENWNYKCWSIEKSTSIIGVFKSVVCYSGEVFLYLLFGKCFQDSSPSPPLNSSLTVEITERSLPSYTIFYYYFLWWELYRERKYIVSLFYALCYRRINYFQRGLNLGET